MSDSAYEWVMSNMNESCYQQTASLKPLFILHINESRHVWISHVTCQWVMSHINEPCHISMSHVTYEGVMSYMNESCHIWMSHVTYEWVMSHMNESCHIWMSHVTYQQVTSQMNQSYHRWMKVVLIQISNRNRNRVCTSHIQYVKTCDICGGHKMSQIRSCDQVCCSGFFFFLAKQKWSHFGHKCHKWSHVQMWLLQTCFCFCFLDNGSEWMKSSKTYKKVSSVWNFVWNPDQSSSKSCCR